MTHYITYSKNVFIPVTNVCRNSCAYCGFRRAPDDGEARIMSRNEVENILIQGKKAGCTEALFTFGERPEEFDSFRTRLEAFGYERIIDYVKDLSEMAVSIGLLPHTNAGIMGIRELKLLKPLNASMGLMLETVSEIEAHSNCEGKKPQLRIQTIEDAGRLKIPFTTGLLIGIGESKESRQESLEAIASIHKRYGHIQEVIIQNFLPKPNTVMADHSPAPFFEMVETVATARKILPPDVTIQVAPNLIEPHRLILAGARDLGGISPVTDDHINPEACWPTIRELENIVDSVVKSCGKNFMLKERLPVYPQYIEKGWYGSKVKNIIESLVDEDGYVSDVVDVSYTNYKRKL